ncbi:UNVERIFIED_ORG: hypothetical protein J2Y77_005864, partial [Pseudomonas lini]
MSVQEGPSEKRYDANGVTTIFTIPFLLIEAGDLNVFLNDIEVTSGFTITGLGLPQSTITFTTAPSGVLLLQLDVPFQRLVDYQENGDFLSSTVNRDFDRIWQALKQLLRFSTRALSLGVFDIDGNGFYRAKGNGIINLASANKVDNAATNWLDVKTLVAETLETGQGPANNAANVIYVTGGGVITTVSDKLRELVSVSDYGGSLRNALADGAMVRVPATTTSLSVSATDSPFVLPNLYRVSAEGDLTINLGAGVHATDAGDICRVGARNSTIKLLGPVPAETKATAVTSITGTPGDWLITYTLTSASGAAVGDYAKLFDVGPLPILNGDNAASYILRSYPVMGELYTPLAQSVGSLTYAAGGGSVAFSAVSGALSQYMHTGDLI